jgi:site-specific recombinase XerD
LAALSSLYRALCEANAVLHNPVDGVTRPKEGANEGKTPALSDAQARALLQAPSETTWQGLRDRAMLAVLLYHGLRASELCAIRVGDYAERRGIRTLTIHGKGGKLRYIPVHPQAIAALGLYLEASQGRGETERLFVSAPRAGAPGAPLIRQRIRELIERYADQAGIAAAACRPHSLRTTAATNALEHGADIAKVQDWLGHANPATTRLYDKRGDKPEDSPSFAVNYK